MGDLCRDRDLEDGDHDIDRDRAAAGCFFLFGVLAITGDLCRGRDRERDLESDHEDLRRRPRLRTGDLDFRRTGDLDLLFLLCRIDVCRIGGKP